MTAARKAPPPPKVAPEAALDPIAALTAMLVEMRRDLDLVSAKVDRMTAPEEPGEGYLSLLVAARALGCSDEHLRKLAVRGDIPARRGSGNRWYVRVGDLALANKIPKA
jgi:hypothetical protein